MDKQLITFVDGQRYYLRNSGMGGAFNPPTHPEHFYSIEEKGRHGEGSYSLSYALECEYLPAEVKKTAADLLNEWKPGKPSRAWLDSVYAHFNHCYSPDGVNRSASDALVFGKFWDNAEQEAEQEPTRHLGYMFVAKYYPNHKPDLKRMGRK